MRILLNLATRPYADLGPALKHLRIGMGVLALAALALGLGVRAFHHKAEEVRAREHAVDQKIGQIDRERQGYQQMMRQPANAQTLAQAGALNQLFDEKTFSWTLAMEDLETVLPGGVQVVSLEPARDAKTGRIVLHLRVTGPRDRGDDLVQNLEHSKHFLLPHIVGESAEATQGPQEKLEPVSASNRFNFELLAEYNSDAIADRKPEKKTDAEPAPAAKPPAPAAPARPAAQQPATQRPAMRRPVAPVAPGPQPVRPPYTGVSRPPVQRSPYPSPKPNPTPGGPR
jgi:type IV pilus assembly protein PilN